MNPFLKLCAGTGSYSASGNQTIIKTGPTNTLAPSHITKLGIRELIYVCV